MTEKTTELYTTPGGLLQVSFPQLDPQLTEQIRELEDELGVPIFVRRGKRFVGLTDPGAALIPVIERVLLGKGPKGAEAAVLLYTAAAHYVAGLSPSMKEAVGAVRGALAAGKGRDALGRLRGASSAQR